MNARASSRRPHGLWRLTVRLLRGAGAQDRVRLGLQVVAVVLGLLAATMPLASQASQQRVAARYPRLAPGEDQTVPASARLSLGMASDLYRGRTVTRWQVTAGSEAPVPPGVAVLPATGHLVVSPGLLAAMEGDESLRLRYPGVVDGVVATSGLATPDELFAVVGVPEAVGPPVLGFGVPRSAVAGLAERDSGSLVTGELLMLVVLPLLGFLIGVSRMAIGVRMSRVAALRRLGLPTRECARLQGRQLALVAAAGSALGCTVYLPFSAAVGLSGVTGITWFPEDTAVQWPVLAAVVVLLTVVGRQFGRSSTLAALRGPTKSRVPDRWPRWLTWLSAATASVCVGVLSGVWLIVGPGQQWQQLPVQYAVLVAWLVLAGLVFAMAVQVSDRLLARLLRSDAITNPKIRLGLRLARPRPPGTTGSQVAVGLLIVVAGFSTVITGAMAAAAIGTGKPISVSLYANELGGAEQRTVVNLLRSGEFPGYAAISGYYDGRAGSDEPGVDVLVATCATIAGSGADCGAGPVVLVASDDTTVLKAGRRVSIDLIGERTATLEIPQRTMPADNLPWSGVVLIPPTDATWLSEVSTLQIDFVVPETGNEYDALLAKLARDAPSVQVSTMVADRSALEFFTQQQSLLQTFTAIGFLLCALSLGLAGMSMNQDQLRSITALQLLGITRNTLRTSLALSKALPVAIATSCIALVTMLGGQALQAALGLGAKPNRTLWAQTSVATLVAVAMTAILGALITGRLDLAKPDSRE